MEEKVGEGGRIFFKKRKVIKTLEDFHILEDIVDWIFFLSKIWGKLKHQIYLGLMSYLLKEFYIWIQFL